DAARAATLDAMRALLDAAVAAPVPRVVLVSSAIVYGAHAGNPIPMDEDAPLRANADYGPSLRALAVEEMARSFRRSHSDVALAVLRPAAGAGPVADSFIARMFEAPRLPRIKGFAPPVQVLHHDDLAGAVGFACARGLDGEFNVAPDGSLGMDEMLAMSGKRAIELPESVAFSLAARAWRVGLASSPPGELRFLMHPLILDGARLAAAGWRPRHSNRDAIAATIEARKPWIALGPGRVRKADLAKGAAATLGLIGAMAAVRRVRKR
ncbi:MAG: NAD-dependent epimerase/dehydratase family protein, partial [Actinomycetota bacterium]